jgi:hypothetical protein
MKHQLTRNARVASVLDCACSTRSTRSERYQQRLVQTWCVKNHAVSAYLQRSDEMEWKTHSPTLALTIMYSRGGLHDRCATLSPNPLGI